MSRIVVDGDFDKLEDWEKAFANADKLLEAMSRDMAEELVGLVKDGWRNQADPYGERWKAKKRPDGRQILVGKTARLKGGWHVRKSGRGGFTIAPSVTYAGFHQTGTKFIPPRRMVPTTARGLPKAWRDSLNEIIQDHFAAHFGSKKAARLLKAKGSGVGFVKGRIVGSGKRFNITALMRKAMKSVSGE